MPFKSQMLKDFAAEVIQNADDIGTGRYYRGNPSLSCQETDMCPCCGIGHLWVAARRAGAMAGGIIRVVEEFYGLTRDETDKFEKTNDSAPTQGIRKHDLLKLIATIPVMERSNA